MAEAAKFHCSFCSKLISDYQSMVKISEAVNDQKEKTAKGPVIVEKTFCNLECATGYQKEHAQHAASQSTTKEIKQQALENVAGQSHLYDVMPSEQGEAQYNALPQEKVVENSKFYVTDKEGFMESMNEIKSQFKSFEMKPDNMLDVKQLPREVIERLKQKGILSEYSKG